MLIRMYYTLTLTARILGKKPAQNKNNGVTTPPQIKNNRFSCSNLDEMRAEKQLFYGTIALMSESLLETIH